MVGQRLPIAGILLRRLVRRKLATLIVVIAVAAAFTSLDSVVAFFLLNLLIAPAVLAFDLVCLACRLISFAIVAMGIGLVEGLAAGAWGAWDDQVDDLNAAKYLQGAEA